MISVETRKDDKLIVRPMQAEDITAVLDIDHRINGRKRSITYDDLITGDLGGELNLSVIAEIDRQAVGFVLARHSYVGEPVTEAGLIQVIGVDPDYWGQGIATTLINTLEASCKSKGLNLIRTMVKYKDSQLRKFFKLLGYEAGQLIDYNKEL